ncbi:unnamed protein product [Caenorhabditis brenneri]
MLLKHVLLLIFITAIVLILSTGLTWLISWGHCLRVEQGEMDSCVNQVVNITHVFSSLSHNLDNRTRIRQVLKFCNNFHSCHKILYCPTRESQKFPNSEVDRIKRMCASLKFYEDNLLDCWRNIAANQSECVKEWRKFEKSEQQKSFYWINKRVCNEFFGESGCMRLEMEERCGRESWVDYRNWMIQEVESSGFTQINTFPVTIASLTTHNFSKMGKYDIQDPKLVNLRSKLSVGAPTYHTFGPTELMGQDRSSITTPERKRIEIPPMKRCAVCYTLQSSCFFSSFFLLEQLLQFDLLSPIPITLLVSFMAPKKMGTCTKILICVLIIIITCAVILFIAVDPCFGVPPTKLGDCYDNLLMVKYEQRFLKINKKPSLSNFLKTCDKLYDCLPTLFCWTTKQGNISEIHKARNVCDAVTEYSRNLGGCWDQIEAKSSKCLEDWKQLESSYRYSTSLENKIAQKKSCDRIFGSTGCLRREMTELCGRSKWNAYERFFLYNNQFNSVCRFSELD